MVDESKIHVTKRNGERELLNLDKIHKILEKACHGITGVSVSDIEMKARLSFYDGITSKDIHAALIKSAADLITENSVNYQYVAGNLLNYEIRKQAWGGMTPPRLYDHVKAMTDNGYYHPDVLGYYSESDWDKIDDIIDHDRDFNMTYIGVNEYMTKYAMRDRSSKDVKPLESPQLTYMLIAVLSALDSKSIKDVKSLYNDFSLWDISLPTPIMAGLRSPTKQFSSCTLISSNDTLDSLTDSSKAIAMYASKKAGIGIDGSRVRAEGSSVGKEKAIKHTGVMPFFKMWEASLKSCSQGGVRGASATLTACLWHLEIEYILVLKNNKGIADTRVRKLDYSIQINDYLYTRFVKNQDITLFSPSDTPGLYDAFFGDKKKFAELYEKYEKDYSIRKKTINARELFSQLMTERKETGRIYVFNVDNVNDHSNFNVPITTSNLCLSGDTLVTISVDGNLMSDIALREVIEIYETRNDIEMAILSKNLDTSEIEFKKITKAALMSSNAEVMKITDETGKFIICTPEHKIYTKNRGWVEAQHLLESDILDIL